MSNPRPATRFSLTAPGPLRLYSTAELLRLPPPGWQIDRVLPQGGLVGVYGPPGHGKSFVAADLAMHIATGMIWQGHATQQGYGLYIGAEGGSGFGKRVGAWLHEKQLKASDVHMAWLMEAVQVQADADDMDRLFSRIDDEVDRYPSVIVVDTLARCFDGDENTQEDMNRFIGGVDRMRRDFNATVIVVHHTRLDADRERGSTAFRGAADTMISVRRGREDGGIVMECTKQKDAEEFPQKDLRLKMVDVFDSCVIVADATETSSVLTTFIQQAPAGVRFTDIMEFAKSQKMSPATVKRRLLSMLKAGTVYRESGVYFPLDKS